MPRGGHYLSGQRHYPRGFRWLCLALVVTGQAHLGLAARALQLAADYAALGVSVSPAAQVVAGLGWGVALIIAGWRLWRVRPQAARWASVILPGYALFWAIWWRVFARSDYALDRWPFAVFSLALLVGGAVWFLARPRVRALWRVSVPDSRPPDAA